MAALVASLGSGVVFLSTHGEIGENVTAYPSLELESLAVAACFSSDYREARGRFREAVKTGEVFEAVLKFHMAILPGGTYTLDVAIVPVR